MIREKAAPRKCHGCRQRHPLWRFGFCKGCFELLADDLRERLEWASGREWIEGEGEVVSDPAEREAAFYAAVDYLRGGTA